MFDLPTKVNARGSTLGSMLIELSNYVLEPLRESEEYIVYTGRRDGELPAILVVAPCGSTATSRDSRRRPRNGPRACPDRYRALS